MNATGSLTIEFSKNILRPAISGIRSVASHGKEDANKSRFLQESAKHDGYFDIEDVMSVRVKD